MLSLSLWNPTPLEIHWCWFCFPKCVQAVQNNLDVKPQTDYFILSFFSLHYKDREWQIVNQKIWEYFILSAVDICMAVYQLFMYISLIKTYMHLIISLHDVEFFFYFFCHSWPLTLFQPLFYSLKHKRRCLTECLSCSFTEK